MAFETPSPLTATTAATAACSIAAASLVWWNRVRRLTRLRQAVASIHGLSEEIAGAPSAEEILDRIAHTIPPELGLQIAAILPVNPESGHPEAAAGKPVNLEAIRRCASEWDVVSLDQSLTLPMSVRGERHGVLQFQVAENKPQEDELVALQHLANQVAITLELISQRELREQMMRSEKLGATGQLISSIAADLKAPLQRLAESHSSDARIALEMLDRLISFGRPDQVPAQPIDLTEMLRQLLTFRTQPWRLQHIQPTFDISEDPLVIHASWGQIEQALLSLIIHAEQALHNAAEKRIHVRAQAAAGAVEIELRFTAPASGSLGVARTIIEGHGGSMRIAAEGGETVILVEHPLLTGFSIRDNGPEAKPSRSLTLLVVHADAQLLRPLIVALSDGEHRAVPSSSLAEAVERAARFRFDAVLASRQLDDMPWATFSSRIRESCPVIGLLTNGTETAPAGLITLHLPAREAEINRMLLDVEAAS